jgi:aminomethyltransferase
MRKRVSALESRHVELGAGLADWNDMAVAWEYHVNIDEQHAAVREAAGLFDMSGLRKVHIKGPDALAMVDYLLPRDMSKIYVGKSVYSLVLTEDGGIADDAIIYRLAEDHFLLVFGTGDVPKQLEKAARGKNVTFALDDDLHCISLQGPASVGFLDSFVSIDLPTLRYFHHQDVELFGHRVLLSRTGYSGERGYDIFVHRDAAGAIWDNILERGRSHGIQPCSFVCLNVIRIEAGLHFAPFDMSPATTPWEVGLGWAISASKPDYIGKAGVLKRRGNQLFYFAGIVADHHEAVGQPIAGGEKVFAYGKEAGVITASLFSNRLKKSIALAHLKQFAAEVGTPVIIHGPITANGKVAALPFYDPQKTRVRG